MAHPIYNILCKEINSLDEVSGTEKVYYKYKSIHFLYKLNGDSNNLLVSFHGSVPTNTPTPVFKGYKITNKMYNILAISDKLIEYDKSKKLTLSWYLTPNNFDYNQVYIEIISFFNDKYENMLFTGSSGGGFPSLFYASYFKKYALISNSQLYLPKYCLFKNLYQILDGNIYLSECNIEKIIDKYGPPKLAYIYVNKNDGHHYHHHFLPFKKFIFNNKLTDQYKLINFIGSTPPENKTHHNILYPRTENEIVVEIFGSMTE
jgi:hypothetical protein